MEHLLKKNACRQQRKKRIRKKVLGTKMRPRLSVYRSLHHCYVQLIDDAGGRTLLGLSTLSKEVRAALQATGNSDAARQLGRKVAEKALAMDIRQVVFDRNGFLYHGRVKAVAEGAREKGLQF